jgi:hypothetical protein
VAELLAPGESLETVSAWADGLRGSRDSPGERPETARWHFVNIPLGQSYDAARDCPVAPSPSCVVAAVAAFADVLARDGAGSPATATSRYEALKFLVHLVGDLHQPLHCADDGDAGGNLKTVVWLDGSVWKLHAVWDEALLAERMKRRRVSDPMAYANRLFAEIGEREHAEARPSSPSASATVGRGAIEGWANAAHALAAGAYADLGPADASGRYHLDERYYDRHGAEVEAQLTRAGIHLARILNESLR